ncbi:HAD family hydrolase [Photobacterium galatheae]|uniref:Haloacid dehalogenase n=1 Tax=Photobacterium galatheae TaxID=1654360 RepID=A0A066RM18_9GAMM|nr:HAD family hydrolase [Photobacterium galatheae]KDM91495.1 haloacid dehalogenase [Photobacterium galatheae]MCM0149568.1 HAD family hydrolase [Photobacterium galatheae]
MYHVMFDVDGTLIQSCAFDEQCFLKAVKSVTGLDLHRGWERYPHATDRGILRTFIENQAPEEELISLEKRVKAAFIQSVQYHLNDHPAQEVRGAKAFFHHLQADDRFLVSVATGGWGETALLKLQSAGFQTDNLHLASSNDHYARTQIMLKAREKAGDREVLPLTYFGDAVWDLKACQELGVNLVIVGQKVVHDQMVNDYLDMAQLFRFIAA